MNTIYTCDKCNKHMPVGGFGERDWLIVNVPDSKTGEMVIRCPKHITKYAIRKAGGHTTQGFGVVGQRYHPIAPAKK